MPDQDNQIIRRVQAGDVQAYAVLVTRHHAALLGFIHRLLRDAHLAEDVGQEVFLDAYKALPRFNLEQGTPFAAWLFILARNRCVSELRRRGRRVLLPLDEHTAAGPPQPAAEILAARNQERAALAATLGSLPEPFRTTILLSLQGEPLEDIAAACGVPVSTVKTRLFRAKEKLRSLFGISGGGERCERPL